MTDSSHSHAPDPNEALAVRWVDEEVVESENAMGKGILKFTIGGMIVLLAVVTLMIRFAEVVGNERARELGRESRSLALIELRLEAQQKLGSYRILDGGSGTYQIPIERAMAVIARESATENPSAASE
jgi:hypothetical protein